MRQAPLYIALMLLGFPATLHAQVPDPPDTEYSEGGLPNDPEYERWCGRWRRSGDMC